MLTQAHLDHMLARILAAVPHTTGWVTEHDGLHIIGRNGQRLVDQWSLRVPFSGPPTFQGPLAEDEGLRAIRLTFTILRELNP